MATVTPNIGLTLPAGNEKVSRQTINDNMVIIDTAFGNAHDSSVDSMQAGLSNVVDGDTTDEAIPAGAYAYIKNNEHSLAEGYYQNTSGSAFPASGGTADSTVFTPVSTAGILNSLNNKLSDTGWIEINSKVSYRRIYQTVYVGIIVPGNFLTHSWQSIATLPQDCVPYIQTYNMCFRNADGGIWMDSVINPQGLVSVMGTSGGILQTQIVFATGT